MSIVSSNMISKHYCPECDSFDLLKLHRSFVEKHILGSNNKLQCRACGGVFKEKNFEQNIPKEMPVFLETPNPITVPEKPQAAVTAAKSEKQSVDKPSVKTDVAPKATHSAKVEEDTITDNKVTDSETKLAIQDHDGVGVQAQDTTQHHADSQNESSVDDQLPITATTKVAPDIEVATEKTADITPDDSDVVAKAIVNDDTDSNAGDTNSFTSTAPDLNDEQAATQDDVIESVVPAPVEQKSEVSSHQLKGDQPEVIEDIPSEVTKHTAEKTEPLEQSNSNFKVTETILLSTKNDVVSSVSAELRKAPPHHSAQEHLVDEMLIVKEKKAAWPYMAASVFVLLGAAYAFVWMPMSINAEESNLVEMDLGNNLDPLLADAEPALPDVDLLPSPTPVVLDDAPQNFQLASEITTPVRAASVTKPALSLPKKILVSNTNIIPPLPDLGTKADRALGGLSTEQAARKPIQDTPRATLSRSTMPITAEETQSVEVSLSGDALVTVPVKVSTSQSAKVNQAIAPILEQMRKNKAAKPSTVILKAAKKEPPRLVVMSQSKISQPSLERAAFKKPVKSNVAVTRTISQPVTSSEKTALVTKTKRSAPKTLPYTQTVKKRAAIKRIKSQSMTDSAAMLAAQSVLKIKEKQQAPIPAKQKQAQDSNAKLLERVAVKFIQQDLDKLLPN